MKKVAVLFDLCRGLQCLAGVLLVLLMGLSGASVTMRMCGRPFAGAYELAGFMGALLAGFALAETQRCRGHVELDVITRRFSPRAQRVAGTVNVLLGALVMIAVSGQLIRRALTLAKSGEVSETLRLPFAWVMLALAGGFIVLALVYVADAVRVSFMGAREALQYPVDEDRPATGKVRS